MNTGKVRVGVLASGSGTNFRSLVESTRMPGHPAEIVVLGSDRKASGAVVRARDAGIPSFVELLREYPDRVAFDKAIAHQLRSYDVDWVCLAGYMKLVGEPILKAFPSRILNVHPSLLPAFPGLNAPQQALDYGVRVSGCTVHLVNAGTDTGPIVAQQAVDIQPGDDAHSLHSRIQLVEHELFPKVLRWAAEGRISPDGRVDYA
ncbi:MAG: phosphoribosylglycinamide formyltransferase [Myxococcota bacterium]